MLILALFLIILFMLLVYGDTRKPRNFPPGPKWFPIIGCAWQLRKLHKEKGSLAKATQELATKYGSVVGARIGRERTVFVCGLDVLKEMFRKDELNGRPHDIMSTSRTLGKRRGMGYTDAKFHLEQKKFVMGQLKRTSFRKKVMAHVLEQRVSVIIDELEKKVQSDSVICMTSFFPIHILNTLYFLLTGDKCSSQEMEELFDIMEDFAKNIPLTGTMFGHFPFLRHICPDYCGYNIYVNIHQRILEFVSKRVQVLKKACDSATPDCGFVHPYLMMVNSFEGNGTFSEDQMVATCLDLLIGGFDTSCNAVGFVFLYLILYPDVQRKAQEEIDRVVGRQSPLTLNDRARLQYVECVILESIRLFVGRAFLIPRRALTDATLNGYFIPKDTVIHGNCRLTLLDECAGWKDPKTFYPERFIKNGRISIPDNFTPFGWGRRRCAGEILARANVFLIVASLLQTFNFKPVPGCPPVVDVVEGFTPSVKPFKASITLR
ncbi:hypothetical protein RI129_011428 [Pyrocoelia pectoralis]|uniref:Cytochrome P450 n=1 Tax=Pyrocoelia pectoralis TaxID=417401 RepID=A0AAN7V415_9COLE